VYICRIKDIADIPKDVVGAILKRYLISKIILKATAIDWRQLGYILNSKEVVLPIFD